MCSQRRKRASLRSLVKVRTFGSWNLRKAGGVLLALAALVTLVSVALHQAQDRALAQIGNGYDLGWWTVDGGGGAASDASSDYTLMSTAGQPDAGPALTGGDYVLVGGFWPGAGAAHRVYLPLVLRNFE